LPATPATAVVDPVEMRDGQYDSKRQGVRSVEPLPKRPPAVVKEVVVPKATATPRAVRPKRKQTRAKKVATPVNKTTRPKRASTKARKKAPTKRTSTKKHAKKTGKKIKRPKKKMTFDLF